MRSIVFVLLVLYGCSSEAPASRQRTSPDMQQPVQPAAGSGGAPSEMDFDNVSPDAVPPDAGEAVTQTPTQNVDCNPGFYLGTYSCDVIIFGLPFPLMGDVSFNLSVNESVVDRNCEASDEFCADLVIEENSGTLFGLAGLVGFETRLDGALDCTTGEFRATGIGGRYGNAVSTNPNDPNALWTVQDPPLGMFEGELMGMHTTTGTEAIEGMWNLAEAMNGTSCNGPFHVELQP